MGANVSSPLRTPEVDWPSYIEGAWRSHRTRELDELGGLLRPAVKRGDSFQKKLEFLGTSVLGRATEIQNLFTDTKSATPEVQAQVEQVLNAASKRLSVRDIVNGVGSVGGPKARKPVRAFQKVLTRKVRGVEVAEWRIRLHAARRRTMLIIRVVALLRSGVHSQARLSRVDSFSYMIPDILGEDCTKFVDQQLKSITARAEAEEACIAAKAEVAAKQAGPGAARSAAAAAAVAAADAAASNAVGFGFADPHLMHASKQGQGRESGDIPGSNQALEPATPDTSPSPLSFRQRRVAAAAAGGGSLLDQALGLAGQVQAQGPAGLMAKRSNMVRRSCSGRLQYPGGHTEDEGSDADADLPQHTIAPKLLALSDMSLVTAARTGQRPGQSKLSNPAAPRASYSGASSDVPQGAAAHVRASYSGGPSGAAAGHGPGSVVAFAVGMNTGTAATRFAHTSPSSSSSPAAAPNDGSPPLMPTPPPMDNKQRRSYLMNGHPARPSTSGSTAGSDTTDMGSIPAHIRPGSMQAADPRPSSSSVSASLQRNAPKRPDLHPSSWNGSTVFVPNDAPKLMAGGIVSVGASVGFIARPVRLLSAAPEPRSKSVGRKHSAARSVVAMSWAGGKGGGGGQGKKSSQASNPLRHSTATCNVLSLSDDLASSAPGAAAAGARRVSSTGGAGAGAAAAAAAGGGKALSPAGGAGGSGLFGLAPTSLAFSPTHSSQQQSYTTASHQTPSPSMHTPTPSQAPHSTLSMHSTQSVPSSPSPKAFMQSQPGSPTSRQSQQTSPSHRPSNLSPQQQGHVLQPHASAPASEGPHHHGAAPGASASAHPDRDVQRPLVAEDEGGGREAAPCDLRPASSGISAEVELWRVDSVIEEEQLQHMEGEAEADHPYERQHQHQHQQQQQQQQQNQHQPQQQQQQQQQSPQQWQQARPQSHAQEQHARTPQSRQRAWQAQAQPENARHAHGSSPAAAGGGGCMVTNARRRLQSMDSYLVRTGAVPASASNALELQRLQRMMVMFVNRNNCAWADAQRWSPPVLSRPKEDLGFLRNYATAGVALDQIGHGRMAFWFLCGEDSVGPTPRAGAAAAPPAQDIWTTDPYRLMYDCRRGLLHGRSCVKGYSFQSRVLAQLALALADAAGQDAVDATHLVLSINEDQQEEVVKSLWDYKFYGFQRQNVIIISQAKRPGYRYHPEHRRFVSAANAQTVTPTETIGTGLAAMQLNWHPDAFVLSAEGLVQGLRDTTLELLSSRGVKWMVSYRARDLAVMSKESLLDTKFLAQAMWLQARDGAAMVTQAMVSDTMGSARALDSMLLSRDNDRGGSSNVELRMLELASRRMSEVVSAVQSGSKNKVTIGLQRYMFHVPSLKDMLTDNQHFRPKLRLRDDLLAVSLDIADVTTLPSACMAVVQVDQEPPLLMSAKELDLLLPLVQQQDVDQRLLAFLKELKPQIRIPRNSGLKIEVPLPRHTSAVFLDGSTSCMPAILMALALARPNIDCVQLVMFVGEEAGIAYGQSIMAKVLERVPRTNIKLGVDVVVRGGRSLMEAMQRFVSDWRVDLVVVPSTCLTRSSLQSGAILGSVALSILKRMDVPVLMVTSKAAHSADVMFGRKKLRAMLLVENWAMPLLDFMCDRILVQGRADKLLLGQVIPKRISTRQQKAAYQCLMNDMRILAESRQVESVDEVEMDGIHYDAVEKAVEDEHVNLLAVHLPPGAKSLPKDLIGMLGTLTCGVLIMKGAGFRT